jgi:hypothetical protein
VFGAHRREHHRRQRNEEQGHAQTRDHERRPQLGVGHRRGQVQDEPREPGRLEREAGGEDSPAPEPFGQPRREGGHDHRHGRPRQDPQPGLEGRLVLHELEELRQEEDRAEHAEAHEQGHAVHRRERPPGEQAQREHGVGMAPLPHHEAGQSQHAPGERGQHPGARPSVGIRSNEPEHHPEEADGGEAHASEVEGLARTERLAEPARRQHDQDDADGHVDPEDALP